MNNYKTYSFNAFIALKDEQNENGFILYQPHENVAIYTNRYGQTLIWRSNESGDTITIKSVTYPMPSELSTDDLMWLRRIAKHKHWYGGVHKIDYYMTLTAAEIDVRGIDPYFYGWLAQYHYDKKNECDYDEKILSEKEYEEVCDVAQLMGQSFEDVLETRLIAKENNMTDDEFILLCIKYANAQQKQETDFEKTLRLVKSLTESIDDTEWKEDLANRVLDVINNAIDEY